ncbi:helix-turn-helix transcriptional regulator [Mucilaginibacter sp. Bleaf8]|uniref:helix-turn-helix domain-containing protein n=1 Tax=Mucilaginibacter sp. Bleaf8 TaxID=2834430 RepID=UPI001BCDF5E7|nr:AraC family transcriptional regulator [Mucilaginibacter sp. Bleaf8]MBS7564417.1 helix-turn-helix transcriptional regulator [Mucilaginibacter sp. Bleaf8]
MDADAQLLDIPNALLSFNPMQALTDEKLSVEPFQETLIIQDNFAIIKHEGPLTDRLPVKTNHYALVLCLQGSVTRTIGSFQFSVTSDTLHLATPKLLNSYQHASQDLQLFVVLFKRDFLDDSLTRSSLLDNWLDGNPGHAPIVTLSNTSRDRVYDLFQKLDQEYHTNENHHVTMLKLQLMELLLESNRACKGCPATVHAHLGRLQQLVKNFRSLVDEHFLTHRTVKEYADLLFVTAKHLSEAVKQETGLTPLHFIHQRQFQEASYLLSSSDLSIKEIADQLGFDTSSHFSRFFKHFSGYTPTAYQQVQGVISF